MQKPSYGKKSIRKFAKERYALKPVEEAFPQKHIYWAVVGQLLSKLEAPAVQSTANMVGPESAGISYRSQWIRFRRTKIRWLKSKVE